MGRGRLTGLLLSGLLLLSLLSLTASLEPFQPEYEGGSVTDLSAQQISALEELPDSVNVEARSDDLSNHTWNWAFTVKTGGGWFDTGYAIAVDSSGNAYVTGEFRGTVAFGSTNLTSSGNDDIFIAKLDSSGNWQWAVKAGSSSFDFGRGIAVDSSGNSYVTGVFSGTATFGSTSLTSSGYDDIFIAKLDSSGNWQWAVKAGGTGDDSGNGIAVDSSGNAYVTGEFRGTVAFGSTNLTSSGYDDIFIAKLDSSGNWQWAVKAGGSHSEDANGIAVDSSGNSYVTGLFYETATFGSTNLTSTMAPNDSGSADIYIAKLDSSGNWQWAVKAGGTGYDSGNGIAVDSSGNAYVTGEFGGTVAFGSTNLTSSGYHDIFIAKLDSSGNWQWVVKAGGSHFTDANGIAVDSSGNSYVTGHFQETSTFGSTSLTSSGDYDLFIAKLDSSGNWQWAVKASGSSPIRGYGIAVDSSGNAYVTGDFYWTATFGSTSLSGASIKTTFIAQLSPDSDSDGVADSSDQCPGHDDSVDVDADGTPDGCDPLIDSDGDGVADSSDQCSGHDDSVDVDADGTPDGCDPLVDSDSDGVADSLDLCPGHDDSVDVDTDGTPDGCDPLIDSDGDGVADSSDQCPGHDDSVDVDADGIVDGCDPLVDSDSDGVADSLDLCPGHDDSVDVDADGIVDGCDPLVDSDSDGVADSLDLCPGHDDSVDVDADGIPDGCDTYQDGNPNPTAGAVDEAGSSSVGISSMICLSIIGLFFIAIVIKKHSGRRGHLNRPFIGTPSAVGGQGMVHQATPVSNSTQQQDDLQSNIKQMELRRQQAEYEADLLRKQLSDSASFTALQNQEMQAEMVRLQQTVEKAEQDKAAILGELENAKESTSIVQHITYNIQDSAISGDISSIGLNEKDD